MECEKHLVGFSSRTQSSWQRGKEKGMSSEEVDNGG